MTSVKSAFKEPAYKELNIGNWLPFPNFRKELGHYTFIGRRLYYNWQFLMGVKMELKSLRQIVESRKKNRVADSIPWNKKCL